MHSNRVFWSFSFMLAALAATPAAYAAASCPANNSLSTPTTDFTIDNVNHVVTHLKTGLMWKQCAEGLGGAGCATGTASLLTWSQGLNAATTPFAGYSDWRLPNDKELESIVETACSGPSINEAAFPATPAANYFWSSTAFANSPGSALVVLFNYGDTNAIVKPSSSGYVRLVRGGQSYDAFATVAVVPLNDTGQLLCYHSNGGGVAVSCTTTGAGDGRYGRDAANTAGVLTKTGAGTNGFDFTKIANNGTTLGTGVALGSLAGEWACTQDNVTGLTWEVKTSSGLRSQANTYTWYSTDAASNGGNAGTANGGTCTGSNCDTQSYVAAVNATAMCGYSDWRMPSLKELLSLENLSVSAGTANIDNTYFPNTPVGVYYSWTANSTPSNLANAMVVNFYEGPSGYTMAKSSAGLVRLVRGTQ